MFNSPQPSASEYPSINQQSKDNVRGLRRRDRGQPRTTASVQSLDTDPGHATASPSLSETPSEEDYDENIRPSILNALDAQKRYRNGAKEAVNGVQNENASYSTAQDFAGGNGVSSTPVRGSADAMKPARSNRSHKFRDFVFSRQVSTFDAKSEAAMNSPFHGFYTLFWLSVTLLICKICADNWRAYGNLLGSSDIMRSMFHKDGTGSYCPASVESFKLTLFSNRPPSLRRNHVRLDGSQLGDAKACVL